jgi:hypothetical protein
MTTIEQPIPAKPNTLTFQGYGPLAKEKTVMVGKISAFEPIDYNGLGGTKIWMDGGVSINVGNTVCEVMKMLEAAHANPLLANQTGSES